MILQAPRCAFALLALVALAGPAVSADEVVVGMSAAFRGPSRGLSIELYRGSLAYLEHVNQSGGVHGRSVRILAYDDGYNPKDAIDNTIRLVEDDKVFLLFDYMGSPTVTRMLPLLKKHQDDSIFLLCPFTGASPLRRYPYDGFVFSLRASYQQETAKLVEQFVKLGRKRIAVFYQIDAFGRSGWDGVRRQLAEHNLEIRAEATYPRGTPYGASFKPHVDILRRAKPDAIISLATYSAGAGFVRDVVEAGWDDIPIAHISGVDSDNLLKLLLARGKTTGKDYVSGLINSQVVPSYHDTSLPAVNEYQHMMERFRPTAPAKLLDEAYEAPEYSFISFEGFLNAKLLTELLNRLGPTPRREEIRTTMETIQGLDLGIGKVRIDFGPKRHQGLDEVYFTVVRDGRLMPATDADWQRWRR